MGKRSDGRTIIEKITPNMAEAITNLQQHMNEQTGQTAEMSVYKECGML